MNSIAAFVAFCVVAAPFLAGLILRYRGKTYVEAVREDTGEYES